MRYDIEQPGAIERPIEQVGLPDHFARFLRERGISTADRLYAVMIGTPEIAKAMLVDFHLDFAEWLSRIRRQLPTSVVLELDAANKQSVPPAMGVIRERRPPGPLRVLRRTAGN